MKSGNQRLDFFWDLYPFLVSSNILTKGVCLEKKNKYEIFSSILVVIQMRSVCIAVKKDMALMRGRDCPLTLD